MVVNTMLHSYNIMCKYKSQDFQKQLIVWKINNSKFKKNKKTLHIYTAHITGTKNQGGGISPCWIHGNAGKTMG